MCVNEKETGVIAKVDDHSHQQTVHMRGKKERASRVEQVEMNIRVIYDSEMWNVLETPNINNSYNKCLNCNGLNSSGVNICLYIDSSLVWSKFKWKGDGKESLCQQTVTVSS